MGPRWVGKIYNNNGGEPGTVPSYTDMDIRLGWKPTSRVGLSVVGQNVLHDHLRSLVFPTRRGKRSFVLYMARSRGGSSTVRSLILPLWTADARAVRVLGLLAALGAAASAQASAPSREYQVKAVFLFNFTQFVNWPPAAFPEDTALLVIGVLGDDPVRRLSRRSRARRAGEQPATDGPSASVRQKTSRRVRSFTSADPRQEPREGARRRKGQGCAHGQQCGCVRGARGIISSPPRTERYA